VISTDLFEFFNFGLKILDFDLIITNSDGFSSADDLGDIVKDSLHSGSEKSEDNIEFISEHGTFEVGEEFVLLGQAGHSISFNEPEVKLVIKHEINSVQFKDGTSLEEILLGRSDEVDQGLFAFRSEVVINPVGISDLTFFQKISLELFEKPGLFILEFFISSSIVHTGFLSFMKFRTDGRVCNQRALCSGMSIIISEGDSEVAIMVENDEGINGSNEHVESEIGLFVVDKHGVTDKALDEHSSVFNTALFTIFIDSSDVLFFLFIHGSNTRSSVHTNNLGDINDIMHLLKMFVFFTIDNVEELEALFFVGQDISGGEELLDALLSGFVILGIFIKIQGNQILLVQGTVSWDMIGHLSHARELLHEMSSIMHSGSCDKEHNFGFNFFSFAGISFFVLNIRHNISSNLIDSIFSSKVTWAITGHVIILGEDVARVFSPIFSLLVAIFIIRSDTNERLGIVLITPTRSKSTIMRDKDIEFFQDEISKSGI